MNLLMGVLFLVLRISFSGKWSLKRFKKISQKELQAWFGQFIISKSSQSKLFKASKKLALFWGEKDLVKKVFDFGVEGFFCLSREKLIQVKKWSEKVSMRMPQELKFNLSFTIMWSRHEGAWGGWYLVVLDIIWERELLIIESEYKSTKLSIPSLWRLKLESVMSKIGNLKLLILCRYSL